MILTYYLSLLEVSIQMLNLSIYTSFFRRTFFLAMVLFLSACSNRENTSPFPSIHPDVKANLAAPVNCRTARQDLLLLEEEKASVGKQILSGVRSIFPIAAVSGILMGDYKDRVEVATGQYNADLEAKIEQIKRECKLR